MLSIHDILQSNLLDNIRAITGFDLLITLLLSFGMGIFILFIYSRIYRGAMYSASFGVSLAAMTMISATLILAVSSNLYLSLGMMGALSIVRFRTAIKDPMEIVFLFWSIETGIVLATGIFTLAVGVNIVIGCVLLALVSRKPDYPYILVLKCEKRALKDVSEKLKKSTNFTVKSRKVESDFPEGMRGSGVTSTGEQSCVPDTAIVELDIEITLKRNYERKREPSGLDETEFVDELRGTPGVKKAILVSYNGGYMS